MKWLARYTRMPNLHSPKASYPSRHTMGIVGDEELALRKIEGLLFAKAAKRILIDVVVKEDD